MMMPPMNRPETIRNLLELDPHIRVIAASGLGADGQLSRVSQAGVRHFTPKPYSPDALLTAFRHGLEE